MPSSEQALLVKQFRVQDCGARRAANGVVADHAEFVVEHIAGRNRPDNNRHAISSVAIESGLRSLDVGLDKDDRPWSAGKSELIDGRTEVTDRRFHVVTTCRLLQLDRYSLEMTVANIDAMRLRADANRRIDEPVVRPFAQDLQ